LEQKLETFSALDVRDLDCRPLRSALKQNTVVRITGLFDREQILHSLERIGAQFDRCRDEKPDPADTEAPRRNSQKLQIGANSGPGNRRVLGRVHRVFYNPIFAADALGLRSTFVRLARLRNKLFDLPEDFAVYGTENELWTCARLLQYPRGGAFMTPHRDMYSQLVTEKQEMGYFQPILLMSEKGKHYHHGGGYVEIGEERFEFEGLCQAGDVVIYDGRTMHGVADIDPHVTMDLDSFNGRVAAFATLYRHLRPEAGGYGALVNEATKRYGENGP